MLHLRCSSVQHITRTGCKLMQLILYLYEKNMVPYVNVAFDYVDCSREAERRMKCKQSKEGGFPSDCLSSLQKARVTNTALITQVTLLRATEIQELHFSGPNWKAVTSIHPLSPGQSTRVFFSAKDMIHYLRIYMMPWPISGQSASPFLPPPPF